MFTRIFLALMGFMFVPFGVFALLDPQALVTAFGMTVGGPNGDYEMRGIYGGVSLAIGALCFAGVVRADSRRPALMFLITYFGGYLFARAAALLLGPPPTSVFVPFIAFEGIGLALAVAALIAHNKKERGA